MADGEVCTVAAHQRRVNIGDRVRNRVTGFEGVVTGRTEYITGCARLIVQPQGMKDGKSYDSEYVDEPMADLLQAGALSPVPTQNGGPSLYEPK